MKVDNSVNDDVMPELVLFDGGGEGRFDGIDGECKFFRNLVESLLGPITEPIDHATVEQRR